MIPIPNVNTTCYYTFKSEFTKVNGIYTLAEIMSFNEATLSGVDFVASLYTPSGLLPAQYTTDAPLYINDSVLYLTPVVSNGTALYVPSSILQNVPDPMVGCYNKLAIGVSLGLFDNQEQLNWIITELNNIISAVIGVSSPQAKLYSLGTQYMRVSDYEALVVSRKSQKSAYSPLWQQLQDQIALTEAAQNLNSYYKTTLETLAGVGISGSGGP